jgi:uncharacterized protein YecE (DUF72 family)
MWRAEPGQFADLAAQGVYVGTSSWKYRGWCGMLYETARYEWRGKFAESRFNRNCLAEYGQVFKTVCVDAAYYNFPSQQYLEGMAKQVPEDFLFALKVTDAITLKKFPNLQRFGELAGKANENFLNADLFATGFLGPCESIRPSIGLLIFEFSRFWPADYERGRDFIADLDRRGRMGSSCETSTGSNRHISSAWPVTEQRMCSTPGKRCHRSANK